ncbi:DUF3027 domain-containing protein [Frankia sp. AgB32]|uniref:DUF3027 domain-containing protein n=1 Tax=Frankia sp. AgB32 TaxID=631119 RepID=UPI0020100D3A|nr:DUF3027 domain-containing protein [Frankia sp. AgB32]MCK9893177.1 DUF3027 domain-containing protein [Frankia sp. AgB32]
MTTATATRSESTATAAAGSAVAETAVAERGAADPASVDPASVDPASVDPASVDAAVAEAADVEAAETEAAETEAAAPAGRARSARATRASRETAVDATCAAAVDLARAAAVEEAGEEQAVGEHLGVEAESDRIVLHRFACLTPAYRGWTWTVVVTRASRVRRVTVDDVVLIPGDDAMLAPEWVPWSERLRPGDVGVGDLLPTAIDDPRLALRVEDVEELVDTDEYVELGLGRSRVLSPTGREDAVERWYAGEAGPDASIAKVAPAACLTCGFHVRLAGVLGRMFGACANELAPDDGRVTAIDHGCGAHSEALVAPSAHPEPVVYDEDPSDLAPTDVELLGVAAHPPGSVADAGPEDQTDAGGPEPYGHS